MDVARQMSISQASLRQAAPVAFCALLMLVLTFCPPASAQQNSPGDLQERIERTYSEVVHITPSELASRLAGGEVIMLIDTREANEFAVGRLAGAERVDPGIWHTNFMQRFASRVTGKTIVLYCSVGVRSSKLAAYVQDALRAAGARAIYNLKGGIFAWHNERRGLVNAKGPTEFVHPYDRYWGRFVERRHLTRQHP